MKYFSTRDANKTNPITFTQAVLAGLASDGGLYLPEYFPKLSTDFLGSIHNLSKTEIAFAIATLFIDNEIDAASLYTIVQEAIDFDIPITAFEKNEFCMELFEGPTLAFKDFGARFMARVLGYITKKESKNIKVIVATSGDTGSAVAAGFYNVPNVDVYILYPKNKVSPLQEKQLTTWGGNIHALEIQGTFDDCQALAKQLLADQSLATDCYITSANSINIARLIPQSFYYAYACSQLMHHQLPIYFAVPSGNFGNLTAGLFAKRVGMPIAGFIAATNANDAVPQYCNTALYNPKKSVQTISNAMDVGNPSNFERLMAMMNHAATTFKKEITAYSYTDDETKLAMKHVSQKYNYTLDPHGAVAYLGMLQFLKHNDAIVVFLESAHPAKFIEVVSEVLQKSINIPIRLQAFGAKEKVAVACDNNYEVVRGVIGKSTFNSHH